MTLHDLRAQFPHVQHQTYLNHAAISPIGRAVRDALSTHLAERQGETPTSPIANFEEVQPLIERAKARIAQVLGTTAARVDYASNTSSALNVLCRGLDWRPGDRVAIPEGSFPTNVYPFMNLNADGVDVDFVPTREGAFTLADIEEALHPDTRLLSVSWVHFLSGFRADLNRIGAFCNAHDILFCVDAIQGLGALTIDVEEAQIDFLAAGGHKWLMAMQGIGVLYCSEELQEQLRPPSGWLHGPVDWEHLDDYELTFHDDARQFRTGTLNCAGIRALDAALGVYLEAGPARCEERVLELSATLADELKARGLPRYGTSDPDHASGIVTVAPDAPEALFEHLTDRDVTVALRNRKVRFAPTYYNNEDDLRVALDAVDSFSVSQ
jgi:selenocysteine lyase/cysteine desulfurase